MLSIYYDINIEFASPRVEFLVPSLAPNFGFRNHHPVFRAEGATNELNIFSPLGNHRNCVFLSCDSSLAVASKAHSKEMNESCYKNKSF